MHEQITIKVSDQVVRHAKRAASRTKKRIEEVLAAWLERAVTELPVEELSDEEVLALTELRLASHEETALSELLHQNREGMLDTEQRRKLDELMRLYELGLLRKSQALRVAVQRGLREPLQP